ncbi:MAG: AraC family transcriptional regulator [Bacteroidota bacterium]
MPNLRSRFKNAIAAVEQRHPPTQLVENRVSFGAEDAEFSVFDTFYPAERVPLQAPNPLFCGMITGKKVVHTCAGHAIPFLPTESLVVPSDQTIWIDFPGATTQAPTKCLTIEIDRAKIVNVVQRLNELAPRSPQSAEWRYRDQAVAHFANTPGIQFTTRQLVSVFVEDHPDKDVLIDLGVDELVIRMLRLEARKILLEESHSRQTDHPLAAAVEYAKAHLHEPLSVAALAQVACMSEPTFYRYFRNEFGQTPMAFVTAERIDRAQQLLNNPDRSVSDVTVAIGFSSVSHFIRTFRKYLGVTPKQYQLRRSQPQTR